MLSDRCPHCQCSTFAKVDEPTLEGGWDNTKTIRCVECKRTYAARNEALLEVEGTRAQSQPSAQAGTHIPPSPQAPLSGGLPISRDEFLRGIGAIQKYRTMVDEIAAAMKRGGVGVRVEDVGGELLMEQLTRQLEARCRDPNVRDGSMISYMLYEVGGPVREADGREFMTDTPERLWAWWEATERGPFETSSEVQPAGSDGEAYEDGQHKTNPEPGISSSNPQTEGQEP